MASFFPKKATGSPGSGGGEPIDQPFPDTTMVGAASSGVTLSLVRTFGNWPHPAFNPDVWPEDPFGAYTRAPDGRLLPLNETEPMIARGKSFGFLPKPIPKRNVIKGAPYRPAR